MTDDKNPANRRKTLNLAKATNSLEDVILKQNEKLARLEAEMEKFQKKPTEEKKEEEIPPKAKALIEEQNKKIEKLEASAINIHADPSWSTHQQFGCWP